MRKSASARSLAKKRATVRALHALLATATTGDASHERSYAVAFAKGGFHRRARRERRGTTSISAASASLR